MYDRRSWRIVLRDGLRLRRMVQRCVWRPWLAGDRARYLYDLASGGEYFFFDLFRRTVHSVSLHPDRNGSHGTPGALQDDAVRGYACRTGADQHAQQARESAAEITGTVLFP